MPTASNAVHRAWNGVVVISRETLAGWLRDYLQHRITTREPARLGLADVRQFSLTWEECADHLSRLGYRLKVDIIRT